MTLKKLHSSYHNELIELEKNIIQNQLKIEAWFLKKWQQHRPPFYGSVDLRNAGYKISPIDMNLFPGGFNNLNPQFMPMEVMAAQNAVERACNGANSVLLIPENHTRNTFYLQNVYALQNILKQAGFDVRLGSMSAEITEKTQFETALGQSITLEPLMRKKNRLFLKDGFSPCVVLLNNDLSAGVPDILKELDQNVYPPLNAGWTTRRKSHHFAQFNIVAKEFSELMDIDEWSINPYFAVCKNLDFQQREGEEVLAQTVADLLAKIQKKYDEKNIKEEPYVIVKADAGTYGMGVMSVHSPDEVLGLNRKNRNKMSTVKEGLAVTEVIVQEGVYTYETVNNAVSEPVVYMMDKFVLGGFYRVHEGRGVNENLNASGMRFIPLDGEIPMSSEDVILQYQQNRCYEQWEISAQASAELDPNCQSNRFYVYGVIARLALLAASLELE